MNMPLVERARNLFEFLRRVQELKTTSPCMLDTYQRDGAVLWLADTPEHHAVTAAHRGGDPAPDDPLLTVDRLARPNPPTPEGELARWLTEPPDDPERPPELCEAISVTDAESENSTAEDQYLVEDESVSGTCTLEENPDIRERYRIWLAEWQVWAEQELRDRPVRELYGELFAAYVRATGSPEDLELVAGVGCLAWRPPDHQPVKRHLFTSLITIHLDDDTGRLSVHRLESAESRKVELDMLDPGLITVPEHINDVRARAKELEAHPLHRDDVGALVRRLVYTLDADGEYRDQDSAAEPATDAIAAFAPAIILRKRSQQGLVEIFQTIVAQLAEADQVPNGIIPLIDPDHEPLAPRSVGEGALVAVGEDSFLPMPVNDKQLQIINRVNTRAQVLVQGPPGTGKTHTAAALISHLLAQGKRVLVTAHTDRALREVRDKLPDNIKPLSVAVVGTSREDMSDLKVAVQEIAAAAHEHDARDNARIVQSCLDAIDQLRQQRADLYHQLTAAREREVCQYEHPPYHGTLAAIARRLQDDAERHEWLLDYILVGANDEVPLPNTDLVEWRNYLLDGELIADEPEAQMRLPNVEAIPDSVAFAGLVSSESRAAAKRERHEQLKSHAAFDGVLRLDEARRGQVQRQLHELADEADTLARRREQWMNDALADVRAGRASGWYARSEKVVELIERCTRPVEQLGSLTEVELLDADSGRIATLARQVRKHLERSGKIKTALDGSPKIGPLSPRVLKDAKPLFDGARVDGLPPTTLAQLDAVLAWVEATKALTALDRAWPDTVHIPAEDTAHERLQWHRTELEQLQRVLHLADALKGVEQRLAEWELPRPDWNDLGAVRTYASLVDVAAAQDAWTAATEPLARLQDVVADAAQWVTAPPCVDRLRAAVHARDRDEYAAAHNRLERLWRVRRLVTRRKELGTRLAGHAPALARALVENPADEIWAQRLGRFDETWAWASTRSWVLAQEAIDVNALQSDVIRTEDLIRKQIETLAARRAWDYAAAPTRLTGTARADLTQYAQLVQRGGKLSGKYAAQRRAEIRKSMDRCRPSVPVWIMPIYRIAEQLQIKPDMFDVVIVDEASQAGMEATFLQYLAAQIVVIGDDKQVSPTAVGVNQQQLRDLAGQYLAHDRYRDSWQDPKRSLFDEAKMRYGGLSTLTEHWRCVPEIIGFSNRVAYEPDNIRLVPVRQYGIDRLDPIKAVHLPSGYTRGATHRLNQVEADAIVEQIEKCIVDPAYADKTFGVISLLGPTQAKDIQSKLLNRLPREEWNIRHLRCGDAADFQGSERDVMFLSMVAAPEPGRRLTALTQDLYVQRYNVAVSRAKDQVWVFHSVDRQDLHNQDDMRFHLLDYCYGVINRGQSTDAGSCECVPDDHLVAPFDSLFEQRVYNRLVDRGYTVLPQYDAAGYQIDLVVVGGHTRLAVECDGDHWHGPDAFERDLGRQRDLERCGWRFFRIRESDFYVDQSAVLNDLCSTLTKWSIHPAGEWDNSGSDTISSPFSPTAVTVQESPEVVERVESISPIWPDVESVQDEGSTEVSERTNFWPTSAEPFEPSKAPEGIHPSDQEDAGAATAPDSLELYQEFLGSVTAASEATRAQLMDAIREIVAVEGPVLGERLHAAYVHASGGQRVGKQIASTLNSAVSIAVRRGVLVVDNPLGQSGVKPLTFRLPEQPMVRVRSLGPRQLEHVPPNELAAIMAIAAARHGWQEEEEEYIFRTTLDLLDLKRLTKNVREQLVAVFPLARNWQLS